MIMAEIMLAILSIVSGFILLCEAWPRLGLIYYIAQAVPTIPRGENIGERTQSAMSRQNLPSENGYRH